MLNTSLTTATEKATLSAVEHLDIDLLRALINAEVCAAKITSRFMKNVWLGQFTPHFKQNFQSHFEIIRARVGIDYNQSGMFVYEISDEGHYTQYKGHEGISWYILVICDILMNIWKLRDVFSKKFVQ